MEKYKIDNFKNESPNSAIPYVTMSAVESADHVRRMCGQLGLDLGVTSGPQAYKQLLLLMPNEIDYDDEASTHVVAACLSELKVELDLLCYIVWDLDGSVDIISCEDLLKYWDDIWYDASDEVVILHVPAANGVLMVTEQGFVRMSKYTDRANNLL